MHRPLWGATAWTLVCFLFSVMDRLADAFDFAIPAQESTRRAAKFLYRMGYGGASLPG